MKKASAVIVPLVLLALAVALFISSGMASKQAARTSSWTQAEGTIDKVSGTSGGELAAGYDYEGRQYRNEHLAFSNRRDPFRVGQSVIVYVNPANPSESVVQHAPQPSDWLNAGGAISVVLAGILAFFLRRQATPRTSRRRPVQRKGAPASVPRKAAPMSRLRPPAPIRRSGDDPE
ncbi:MAG: DUF3592 domain-containing protein [Acidobacteriota bacterium]